MLRATFPGHLSRRVLTAVVLLAPAAAFGQWSSSAYRALGQPTTSQNGVNLVQGIELNGPGGIAIDRRAGQAALYISDTGNNRILAWRDAGAYKTGDPPALVLGQPGPRNSGPLGTGAKGLFSPLGLAVHPVTGDLYVADYGDNRVLRFPSPFAGNAPAEPDAVFGQPDFTHRQPATSPSNLNKPRSVAIDPGGNLWVVDAGNNRIARFSAGVLTAGSGSADIVIGQLDFGSGVANIGGQVSATGLDSPSAITFDSQGNLYVADTNNARVLRFAAPFAPGASRAATAVWGQQDFTSNGVPAQATSSSLTDPSGVALDGNGNLYVAGLSDNRVLVFSKDTPSAPAKSVVGQADFSTTKANSGSYPYASAYSLSAPADLAIDSSGNLFVADSGNNRALMFGAGSTTASKVWGQLDFSYNGINQVKPTSLNAPARVAIDYSRSPFALYVSDPPNHRVLIWKDSARFKSGDPADLVIGQPDLSTAFPNIDTNGSQTPSRTSLSQPAGLVVNQSDGTLYIADAGNNRVLRYPRPVGQTGRIQPDVVLGQADFSSAASSAVTASSMRSPFGLALGVDGNLFVADTGNNRVLEFPAGAGTGAAAIRVYGQPNFQSATQPAEVSAQTLAGPQGVFADSGFNLYVADTTANRVLVFPNTQSAPTAGISAVVVIGQPSFQALSGSKGTTLKAPVDVALDANRGDPRSGFRQQPGTGIPAATFRACCGRDGCRSVRPIGSVGHRAELERRGLFRDAPGALCASRIVYRQAEHGVYRGFRKQQGRAFPEAGDRRECGRITVGRAYRSRFAGSTFRHRVVGRRRDRGSPSMGDLAGEAGSRVQRRHEQPFVVHEPRADELPDALE
jgi:sugar lactone lactonase YvrE